MSLYDFQNTSNLCAPILLGVTGDSCATCRATRIPIYDLSCHELDGFYCRDCLTKSWYNAPDEVVCCPSCGQDCGFASLQPAEAFHISRDFYNDKAFDKIREQPEIMNNQIGFTLYEAAVFLQHAYSLAEDQILDPLELGGLPGHLTAQAENSAELSLENNFVYKAIIDEVTLAPKMMTTPLELEEDVLQVLHRTLLDFAKIKYMNELLAGGIDLNNSEWVAQEVARLSDQVQDEYPKKILENWSAIVRMWVEFLAWRHIERTAPMDREAAE
ncbi:hypothetical protein GQ44DRAFT_619421 [Phaeosphaeriaceae sp. PMI808]|nr:hypothetical protein GQ44DRAFT_619421 [Phaeosphaeriaceae sp. PMI808]